MSEPDKTGENRDEKGRFVAGVSGNLMGRPRGSLSITDQIRRKLDEIPEGEQKTYLELLVQHILDKALDGDYQIIKQVWNYIDGMPPQKADITIEKKPLLTEGQMYQLLLHEAFENEQFRALLKQEKVLQ